MVRNLLYLVAGAALLAGCITVFTTERIPEDKPVVVSAQQRDKEPAHVLRHVVLLKFKEGTTEQQIKDIEKACCALPGKIEAIYDFEWGTDVSIEKRSEGFTHCFIFTFRSLADRGNYLPHPAHEEFVSVLRPLMDKVLVIDYWAKP